MDEKLEKNERLAFFTESNPRPVIEVSLRGKIIYKNPSVNSFFPDLKTMKHHYFSDFEKIKKDLTQKKKPEYFNRDIKIDQRWFRQFFYLVPHFNSIIIYGSDITPLKIAEEKQKKEQEAKNNFISILSHELRNPLTPILANAQFINYTLENRNGEIDSDILKELVSIIENQAKIMAGLLNDILDVAKLNLQKIELNKKKIDIADPVKDSVKACMPFISMKHQKISVFFSKKPLYVVADPLRIEQIMINLINNASKYTPEKGTIEVHCRPEGNVVKIIVKDNGSGMNKKKISRIFELFNTEGQAFMGVGGLGIGLSIVRNLTLMHQGTIIAKSKGKNKGSEFMLTFPRISMVSTMKKTQTPLPAKNIQHIYKYKTAKILIVEDSKEISGILARILSQKGYTVKISNKGMQAIKLSKVFNPDIALIDIGLPDISGYKVAEILKKNKKLKKMTLIAVTGYGQQKDKMLAKKAGFDHHLIKPIEINSLLKLLP